MASFADTLMALEDHELDVCGAPLAPADASALYTKMMMLYVIQNDLPNARNLWRRIDPAIKGAVATPGTPLACAWDVAKALWQRRDVPAAYVSLRACEWAVELAPLATQLHGAIQQRQFLLMSKAYASVSPASAAALLGLDLEPAVAYCVERGWTATPDSSDPSGRMLIPIKPREAPREFTGMEQLASLTKYVGFLEKTKLTA